MTEESRKRLENLLLHAEDRHRSAQQQQQQQHQQHKSSGLLVDEKSVISLLDQVDFVNSDGELLEDVWKLHIDWINNYKLEVVYASAARRRLVPSLVTLLPLSVRNRNLSDARIRYRQHQHQHQQQQQQQQQRRRKSSHSKDDADLFAVVTLLCQSLLGFHPSLARDSANDQLRLIVQGFVTSPLPHTRLKIGDLLLSINDIDMNDLSQVKALLASVMRTGMPQRLRLAFTSPISYMNLNVSELLCRALEHSPLATTTRSSGGKRAQQQLKKPRCVTTCVTTSNETTQVMSSPGGRQVFFMVMMLYLSKETMKRRENSTEKNDLIYKYPANEHDSDELVALLETIRGLFMTLVLAVKDMDKNDSAVCCSIEHNEQTFNVCFMTEGYHRSAPQTTTGVTVYLVPSERVSLASFKALVRQVHATFMFAHAHQFDELLTVGSGNDADEQAARQTRWQRDSRRQTIRKQFDTFFHQWKRRLVSVYEFETLAVVAMTTTTTAVDQLLAPAPLLSQQAAQDRAVDMCEKMFADGQSVPCLHLPFELRCELDVTLAELESQDLHEMMYSFYHNRRQFDIVGSCAFYNRFVIATHLNERLTRAVYNYVFHFDMLAASCAGGDMFQQWTHVNIASQTSTNQPAASSGARHVLIVVSHRTMLIAVLLEVGGELSRKLEACSSENEIEASPFHMEQTLARLVHLYDKGVVSAIDACARHAQQARTLAITKRLQQHPYVTGGGSSGSKKSTHSSSWSCNAHEDAIVANAIAASASAPASSPNGVMSSSAAVHIECLYGGDVSLHRSILFHASSSSGGDVNGFVMSCPSLDAASLGTDLLARLHRHFVRACLSIKDMFDNMPTTKMPSSATAKTQMPKRQQLQHQFKRAPSQHDHFAYDEDIDDDDDEEKEEDGDDDSSDGAFVEQGAMFGLLKETPVKDGHKRQEKDKEAELQQRLDFWVIGRRRGLPGRRRRRAREFFVCFLDTIDQVLLELAFDKGFSQLVF